MSTVARFLSPDTITLDSLIQDYCRHEGQGSTEVIEERAKALAAVGAVIVHKDEMEVGFSLSLRQALDLKKKFQWDWDCYGGGAAAYLASHLADIDERTDNWAGIDETHETAVRIQKLMEDYLA